MHPETPTHGANAAAGLPTDTTARRLAFVLAASLVLHALLLLLPVLPVGGERASGVALDVQLHDEQRVHASATPANRESAANAATSSHSQGYGHATPTHNRDVPVVNERPLATPAPAGSAAVQTVASNAFDQDNIDTTSSRDITPTASADAAISAATASSPAQNLAPAEPAPVALTGGELALLCPQKQPAYPVLSQRQNESGRVELNVHVGNDGRINAAWVKRTSGSPRLDRAAIAEVMSWKCKAPERDGARVDVVAVQQFTFSLN